MIWLVVESDGRIDWEGSWALLALRLAMVIAVVLVAGLTTCTIYDYRYEVPIKTKCRAQGYSWEATNNRCVQITPVTP